jgi:hypothetical protein
MCVHAPTFPFPYKCWDLIRSRCNNASPPRGFAYAEFLWVCDAALRLAVRHRLCSVSSYNRCLTMPVLCCASRSRPSGPPLPCLQHGSSSATRRLPCADLQRGLFKAPSLPCSSMRRRRGVFLHPAACVQQAPRLVRVVGRTLFVCAEQSHPLSCMEEGGP